MTNKKNKLFVFFFSLIPGAGEMYLGFYKMGASVMFLFLGTIAMAASLFPPLFYLTPVMWFFSFFHANNLNAIADDEFYAQEDDYLFHMSPDKLRRLTVSYRKPLACVMILMGLSVLWNHLWAGFHYIAQWLPIPHILQSFLQYWVRSIPRLASAFLIIWIGVKLIRQKKDSLDESE